MKPQVIQDRTFEFACRIVRLTEHLARRRSFTAKRIASQLFDAGTSVGANLEEASAAQSKADFISKCSIASKEARETRFWLRLLTASNAVRPQQLTLLIEESTEIVAVLTTIVKNARTVRPANSQQPKNA
jgi:four helix bundle protein